MWIYENKQITSLKDLSESNLEGFIYILIMNNGDKYIGKKNFWKTTNKRLFLSNGNISKRKRKVITESNWLTYCSSQKDIKKEDVYKKIILKLCKTKRELTYCEVKYCFKFNVLERSDFLNKNILGKFYRNKLI